MEKAKGKYWVSGGNLVHYSIDPLPSEFGPFDTFEKANDYARLNAWRYVTHSPMQISLSNIFMEACSRWSNPDEVKSYLKRLKGKLLFGDKAAVALTDEQTPGFTNFPVSCMTYGGMEPSPFSPDGEPPIAIVLPEDVALKIVALGVIP